MLKNEHIHVRGIDFFLQMYYIPSLGLEADSVPNEAQ